MSRPRREPLLVRPGARFDCAGDGLCCSDIHAIGPLDEEDITFLSAITDDAIDRHEGEDAAVLLMQADSGTCVFLGETGCALHERLGPEMKPSPCIRFPYGLTATPTGGRITTQHRCPCRTLGTRPPVTQDSAKPNLLGPDGELKPEHAVEDELAWSASETISFSEYERRERPILEALIAGQGLRGSLDAEPLPPLKGLRWGDVADELASFHGPERVSVAARWFGEALGYLIDRRERTEEGRPWANAFDRARARIETPEPPNRVLGDWLADEIWCLRWSAYGSFATARAELATRLAVARRIVSCLEFRTPIGDNVSAGEAVTIVDVIAGTDTWESVLQALVDRG